MFTLIETCFAATVDIDSSGTRLENVKGTAVSLLCSSCSAPLVFCIVWPNHFSLSAVAFMLWVGSCGG